MTNKLEISWCPKMTLYAEPVVSIETILDALMRTPESFKNRMVFLHDVEGAQLF